MVSGEYLALGQTLDAVSATPGPAAAQGMLCGMLVADPEQPLPGWVAWVLDGTEPRGEPARQVLAALSALFVRTRQALAADDCRFEPLLPADDDGLGVRSRARAEWCDGFLFGLGSSGGESASLLGNDVVEAIGSLAAIANLQPPGDEPVVEGDEADEVAFVELVEFVRVAVLLLRHQVQAQRAKQQRGQPQRGKQQ
jgi:uncharacterized protein